MKSIKYWRKKAGLTQSELAVLADVSEITIRRWENTEQNPSWDDIKKLCSVLKVSEAELLNGPGESQWRLEIIFGEPEKEVADLTSTLGNAVLSIGDAGMGVKLVGPKDLWTDDSKFEALIEKIRKQRNKLLKLTDDDD